MKFAPIIDPAVRKRAPKPVRVDLRKVFLIGTAVWLVALIVCAVMTAMGVDGLKGALIICAFGVLFGVMMLIWEYFDRWDYRRLGQ